MGWFDDIGKPALVQFYGGPRDGQIIEMRGVPNWLELPGDPNWHCYSLRMFFPAEDGMPAFGYEYEGAIPMRPGKGGVG